MNDVFDANLVNLERIFNRYKTPTKVLPDFQDMVEMCTRDANMGIPEKDILFCFGYCHMTVVNEER